MRGGSENGFSIITGDATILPGIKYVITVDEDTKMPYDSARRLVETIAHPLNRPRFDEHTQYVAEGYSILHPRLSTGMPEADRSRFMRLFGGEPGIDPYTREVSDVYQDIFGEGSFTGKGIYDVDAFSQSLGGRFPDNLILSHDLLEGSYARAALVSDVEFYEEYPFRYTTDVRRRHRWIRGDWQIASWLLKSVPGPGGMVMDNPISGLSRWKILDNLQAQPREPSFDFTVAPGMVDAAAARVLDRCGGKCGSGSTGFSLHPSDPEQACRDSSGSALAFCRESDCQTPDPGRDQSDLPAV